MKAKKFYPFSNKLIESLNKQGVLDKAKKAYDKIPLGPDKELVLKHDQLDCCFIFSLTDEGNDFWYKVHIKSTE